MALTLIDNNGEVIKEISKEQFAADLAKAQQNKRVREAEEHHKQILIAEAQHEHDKDNRKRGHIMQDASGDLMDMILEALETYKYTHQREGDSTKSVFVRCTDADYEIKIVKKKKRAF